MRVVVDYERCESNGYCMGLVPQVFDLRDDDNIYLLTEHPDEALRPDVERAVAQCPRQALSLEG